MSERTAGTLQAKRPFPQAKDQSRRCEMRKYLLPIVVFTWITVAAIPVLASSPSITGEIEGIEICPQFVCEAAVFNGTCDCKVSNLRTIGFFWVSIQHDPLPPAFHSSAILAGNWNLTTLIGTFYGRVVEGSITNNGNNTFNVTATLHLHKGGTGNVVVTGLLDHTEFPPTFEGELLQ
jgi:hypothetical protein